MHIGIDILLLYLHTFKPICILERNKMITNIFKTFSIQAIAASFFLSFSANLLVLYCRAGGQLYNQIYWHKP